MQVKRDSFSDTMPSKTDYIAEQPSGNSPFEYPKVTAVIPSYHCAPYISDIISKTRKYTDHVIVVDDGSHDGTTEAAKIAGAEVISNDRNLGKGASMRIAARAAVDADILVFIDGDGQHNPDDIPKLIESIKQGKADLVIGSRYLRDSESIDLPLMRGVSNILASIVVSFIIHFFIPISNRLRHSAKLPNLFKRAQSIPSSQKTCKTRESSPVRSKHITDCTSGFRAIKKGSWQKINLISQGFEIEAEMIYEAAKNGLIITDVPISYRKNGSISHLHIIPDGFRTLKILSIKLMRDFSRA